jgi:drug/metabolite transporter, DME family
MNRQTARLGAIAAALLFSTGGAAIKVAAFNSAQVAGLRSGIAALFLLAWLRGRVRITPQILLVSVVYACTLTLFVYATKLTTAANAIFLQSAAPLYILVLGPFLISERFRRSDLTYLVALAIGMVLCFAGQPAAVATAPDPATGDLLAALCGLSWALTLLGLRRVERDGANEGFGMSVVVIGNVMASGASLPLGWPLPPAPAAEWATVVYLGIVQIGLAYVCLTKAMRHLPALEASLLLLLEPVLNPLWAWMIRDEEPGLWTIGGGAIIVAATGAKAVYDSYAVTDYAGHKEHEDVLATKDTKIT